MKELWEKLLKYIRKLTPAIKRAFLLPPGVILVLFPATMVLCIIALNNRGLFPASCGDYTGAACGGGRRAILSQACSSAISGSVGNCRCTRDL